MVRFWSHYTEYGSTPGCNHDGSFDHDSLLKRKLILFPTIEHKRTKLKVLIEITNQIQNAMRNLMVLFPILISCNHLFIFIMLPHILKQNYGLTYKDHVNGAYNGDKLLHV